MLPVSIETKSLGWRVSWLKETEAMGSGEGDGKKLRKCLIVDVQHLLCPTCGYILPVSRNIHDAIRQRISL
jgi:hypothetical protein